MDLQLFTGTVGKLMNVGESGAIPFKVTSLVPLETVQG